LPTVRDIALQFISVLTNRGLQRVANLFVIVILARLMTIEDYGTYGLFVTTITLAAILGAMGMQEALAYLIGQKPEKAASYLTSAFLVLLPLCALAVSATIFWLGITTTLSP